MVRSVIAAAAWVAVIAGISMTGYGLTRLIFGWPRPAATKVGAQAWSETYVLGGGASTQIGFIGFIELGDMRGKHALSMTVFWYTMACIILPYLLRIRSRRRKREPDG